MAEEKKVNDAEPETEVKEEVKPEKEAPKKQKESKPKKNQELEKLKEELQEQKDLLLRTAAEFDNYKRRTEKDRISVAEYAKAEMLKNFLPIFDNVDRAHSFDPESAEYVKGIEMTVKMLTEVVGKLGLIEIGKEGETFDPTLHQAVMHIEDESKPENSVTQVLQKGYKIGDTVIRPAMVQVAN